MRKNPVTLMETNTKGIIPLQIIQNSNTSFVKISKIYEWGVIMQ